MRLVPVWLTSLFVSGALFAADAGPRQLDLGPILKADSLLGMPVQTEGGEQLGKVGDVAIDLYGGHIAFALVDDDKAKTEGAIAIPLGALSISGKDAQLISGLDPAQLREAPRLLSGRWARDANRDWTAKVYTTLGLKPYWKLDPNADPDDKGKAHNFASLRDLRGTPVQNTRGQDLGKIDDLATTADGQIVYALLDQDRGDHDLWLPIPLSAFVVKPGAKIWVLELPEDVLNGTPAITKSNWPNRVSRGWLEYVHVRYGRSTLEGVRTDLLSEAPKVGEDQRAAN